MVKRNGAPERIRTPDPQIRSLVLYPAELPVRIAKTLPSGFSKNLGMAGPGAAGRLCVPRTGRLVTADRRGLQATFRTFFKELSHSPGKPAPHARSCRDGVAGSLPRPEKPVEKSRSENRSGKPVWHIVSGGPVRRSGQAVRSGTSRQKQVSGWLSSRWMLPPWAFTSSATIASPRPTPPVLEPL